MLDAVTVLFWLALVAIGLVAGVSQARGRDYFPANRFLGLAFGSPGVYWLFWFARFGFDRGALEAWARDTHAATWLYAGELALVLWALVIVVRVSVGRAGSAATLTGHLGPPTPEMVDQAFAIIARAERHGVLNEVQSLWLAQDSQMRRIIRKAQKRQEDARTFWEVLLGAARRVLRRLGGG